MELPSPPPPPPERSKRLHNFTLPYLRWGQQRFLRCAKLPSSSPDRAAQRSPAGPGDGKIRLDLVCDARPPKVPALRNGGGDDGVAAARPWNLRTRRAACNEPGDEPPTRITGIIKRGGNEGGGAGDKVKFSVPLLREEIEEDFTAFVGKKPPRRPKKRPRTVQKQVNTLFPGLWLAEEVTACSYDAPESAET